MYKALPPLFLLVTLLILTATAGHWFWRQAMLGIAQEQKAQTGILVRDLAAPVSGDAARVWHERLERAFRQVPGVALVSVFARDGKPLFLRSRLDTTATSRLLEARGHAAAAPDIAIQSGEVSLPDRQTGELVLAFGTSLEDAETRRIVLIAIAAGALVTLIWLFAVVIVPRISRRGTPESRTEEVDTLLLLSERNKRLSAELDDLAGLRETGIAATRETSLNGLVSLLEETLAEQCRARLVRLHVSAARVSRTPDAHPSRLAITDARRFEILTRLLGDGTRHAHAQLVPLSGNGTIFAIAVVRAENDEYDRISQYLRQFAAPLFGFLLQNLARTDALTGLFLRGTFDELIAQYCATKSSLPLALLFADIDHFKEINDSLGHQAGDEVLRRTAAIFMENLPANAACCRYGGEEFAMILPETGLAAAMAAAETLRMMLATAGLLQHRAVTCSFGVTVAQTIAAAEPVELVKHADSALYFSKSHGRNMVSAHG